MQINIKQSDKDVLLTKIWKKSTVNEKNAQNFTLIAEAMVNFYVYLYHWTLTITFEEILELL